MEISHLLLYFRGSQLGLGAADDSGPDGPGLLVAVENLADAAVADPELAGDHAGSDASRCHLDDFQADMIGQRPAIDEDTAKLIDSSLTCERREKALEFPDFFENDNLLFYVPRERIWWLNKAIFLLFSPPSTKQIETRINDGLGGRRRDLWPIK